MESLPVVEMSQANCDILRDWASLYGAAVRQRTVPQQTTIAKHGTLPKYMYRWQCVVLDKPVTFHLRQIEDDTMKDLRISMTQAVMKREPIP